ncbi:MAG: hypothetical protein ABSF12_09460 [Bryobacteraceae bacterium]
MTRRDILMLPFAAAPLLASPASEFWNEKTPENWTDEEVQTMLTKSPWAREAAVSVFGGAGGSLTNRNGAMNRNGVVTNTGRQRANGSQTTSDPTDLRYKAIVRWESALPIREALKMKPAEALADYYILAVVGDLTLADPDADEAQRASRLEMMKEYTKLDRHGGPIPLANLELVKKEGTLFYFSRAEPIKDGQVTFWTRLGPVEVKCKFSVKEMTYRGKLEL